MNIEKSRGVNIYGYLKNKGYILFFNDIYVDY